MIVFTRMRDRYQINLAKPRKSLDGFLGVNLEIIKSHSDGGLF